MNAIYAVRGPQWFVLIAASTMLLHLPQRVLDAQGPPPLPPAPARPTQPRTPPRPRTDRPLPPPAEPQFPAALSGTISGDFFYPLDAMRGEMESLRESSRALAQSRSLLSTNRDVLLGSLDALDAGHLAGLTQFDAQRNLLELQQGLDGLAIAGTMPAFRNEARVLRSEAPPSWNADDPADSLYREARKALSADSYRRAADLFRRIREQYPKSTYAPDAPYWEAFALQRLGSPSDLRAAQDALAWQEKQFPKAATRSDASALATRVEGALARRGDQLAVATLYGRAESASNDGCPKQSDDERVDALNALMQVDAERAMPILKKVLARREPCTQNMRRTAVWLIASRKMPDAAALLVNTAKTDPDREVREQAVFWLANVPTDEAAGMLIELATGNGDMDLRKRAVYALSRSKSPKASQTLRDIAADANAPVELRGDALNWYMSAAGKSLDDPMSFLKEVLGKADEQRFRDRVIMTIAQRKTDASRDFLLSLVQNSKESLPTRRTVIGMFSMMEVTGAQVASLYEKVQELELKRQLLSSMSYSNRAGDIESLLQIARNEKVLELRKQAISQLSRSKDPRALQFLQEIIER